MIKIYNKNKVFLKLLDSNIKNVEITETLNNGLRSLQFQVPCLEEYFDLIQEENYAETADYSFVIKENENVDNKFINVFCRANIEDLTGYLFITFDCYQKSIKQCYQYAVAGTDWIVDYRSQDNSQIDYQTSYITAYSAIKHLKNTYAQEVEFDTKNKKLIVYDKRGNRVTELAANQRNLIQLADNSNSYDYCTILYPIGKDGLMIGELNNGRDYLENFSYSNKRIARVWNTDYEYKEQLIQKGQEYLAELAQPRCSYKIELAKLGKVGLGDSIIIIDNIKKLKLVQRCCKIVRYPREPERDYCEISNLQPNFIDRYIQSQEQIEKDLQWMKQFINDLD